MSQVQCAETCSSVTGCVAFDWTASPESDEPCRLFGKDQKPRLGQPGNHQRFYCYSAPVLDAKEAQKPPPTSSTPSSTTEVPQQPDSATEIPNNNGDANIVAEDSTTTASGDGVSRQASAHVPDRIQIPDFSARSKNAADPSVPVEPRESDTIENEKDGEAESADPASAVKDSATIEETSSTVEESSTNQGEESLAMSWWATTAVQIGLVGLGLRVWRDAKSALQTEEGATHSPRSATTSS